MSELFMECVEEELEPWQKQVPQVNLIDDDDDEPIFVGVLSDIKQEVRQDPDPAPAPAPSSPAQRNITVTQEVKQELKLPAPAPPPTVTSSQIMLPLKITGNAVNSAAPSLTTVAPQPVIVNNQGFIVTSSRLANNHDFIASLGSRYPPGTSFTIVPAGQQLFQHVSPATVIPGAVHRPQVQQIRNNIVTLSNVQNPAVYSGQAKPTQLNHSIVQQLQTFSLPAQASNNQMLVKRPLLPQQTDSEAKKAKFESEPVKTGVPVENGVANKNCPKCQKEFTTQESLRAHMMICCVKVETSADKRIMLVSDFYYGHCGGNKKLNPPITNTTFKCKSCLKVLKNNVRFMNHMKHHLELEKQSSESWESHTTCHHCYRQYMTPFQLQCHIESAHSPIESSTNCKICELAFESEQLLLEHMKDTHKPGEMPYVCQVCNYRSSFFSDVETHFRTVHENTKELLCPFCLKVLRSGHIYMQHYMKHQGKRISRCGKCRLNFLSYKEKVEHRTTVHRTFRKPKALEGLPPGTKVTIRASLTGKPPLQPAPSDQSGIVVTSENPSPQTKPATSVTKSKTNTAAVAKIKTTLVKKQEKSAKERLTKHNVALKHLRLNQGVHTCIECNSKIDNYFSHFPMVSNCGACKYQTSCKVSIGNHMIKFHNTLNRSKFMKKDFKKNVLSSVKLTLMCLNCDLLVDGSRGDLMSRHLIDKRTHVCRVIRDKADPKAKDQTQVVVAAQPTKVLYILTPAPAQKPKETDLKLVESVATGIVASGSVASGSVASGSVASGSVSIVSQPASQQMLVACDQKKSCTETHAVAGSSEGQSEQPSCTSDTTKSL
ncbi:uncharacterized protein V6R79_023326 [Siganus canaliculatus]